MTDLSNAYRRIEEVLLVIRLVYLEACDGTYVGKNTISYCIDQVAKEFEITTWTVTDKCTRQLGINFKDFCDAVDDFIKKGDGKIFNLLRKSIKGSDDLKNEASRDGIHDFSTKPYTPLMLHNGNQI